MLFQEFQVKTSLLFTIRKALFVTWPLSMNCYSHYDLCNINKWEQQLPAITYHCQRLTARFLPRSAQDSSHITASGSQHASSHVQLRTAHISLPAAHSTPPPTFSTGQLTYHCQRLTARLLPRSAQDSSHITASGSQHASSHVQLRTAQLFCVSTFTYPRPHGLSLFLLSSLSLSLWLSVFFSCSRNLEGTCDPRSIQYKVTKCASDYTKTQHFRLYVYFCWNKCTMLLKHSNSLIFGAIYLMKTRVHTL